MRKRVAEQAVPAGLKVERVPLADLVPDAANARLHGQVNLDAIVASLRRFGQAEPLVVQSGTNLVIAGNGRLTAMKALGWSDCDVVRLDLDPIQAAALAIAMNRTAELAEWDQPVLARMLGELRKLGQLEGVGFDEAEVDALLAELEQDLGSPGPVNDEGPEDPPAVPTSRRGDLWLLGDHRLLCGDSTNAGDVARLMAGDVATLLSTDPPYCVNYTGNDRPVHEGKKSGKDWSHVYREVDIADLGTFLHGVFSACLPHVAESVGVYVWHAHLQQPVIAETFERHGLLLHQVLVWVKPVATFGHSYYRWRHEPCAFGWRKGHKPAHGGQQGESVWELDWEGKARLRGNEHPTQKPTRIFELPMEAHTAAGDVVLEPFSGSGSQLIAAQKLGRRCRAMEVSPAFVDAGVRRWQRATGQEARLEGGGTYAEVAAERASG